MKNYLKKYYLIYIFIFLLVGLDLITKFIFDNSNFVVINNVFSIVSTKNKGSAFSMLSDKTIFLTIFSGVFILIIVIFDKLAKFDSKLYKASYCLLIAGAIGNFVDRVIFGYVRDFIRLDFFDFTGINTIFNIADICVVAGITIMIIYLLFFSNKKGNKNG